MTTSFAPVPAPLLFESETNTAKVFVSQYYQMFDSNRTQAVTTLFKDVSSVSFEGTTVQGAQAFLNRINALGIPPNAQHRVITVDAQPSCAGAGAVIVFVTGEYVGQQFSEVFQLVTPAGGSMYVHNDVFRVGNANPFNVSPAAQTVGKGFIEYYYATYDANRAQLASIYRASSCYTFESDRLQGVQAIMEKLNNSPGVTHDPSSLTADVLQVNGNALLLVFITGRLQLSGESNPLNFTETFMLVQEGAGYFVGNHVFKFKYG